MLLPLSNQTFFGPKLLVAFLSSQRGLTIFPAMVYRDQRTFGLGSKPNSSPVSTFSRYIFGPAFKLLLDQATVECKENESENHDLQNLNYKQKYSELL